MALLLTGRPSSDHDTPLPAAGHWPGLGKPPHAPLHALVARGIIHRALRELPLTIAFPDGSRWGAGGPILAVVNPGAFFARLGHDGLIGLGESWMTGDITCGSWSPGRDETDPDVLNDATDELVEVLTILASHLAVLVPDGVQKLRRIWQRRPPAGDVQTTVEGAARNVRRHYDLSNEMFASFLDPSMTYSSGLFPLAELSDDKGFYPDAALRRAQTAKMDAILDLAGVRRGTDLVEIGSGWGSLAIRAATERGARVTTLTLSAEQQAFARRRIADAGLSDLIDVRLEDYRIHARSHRRHYDAAVSVEMIEAIGEDQWPTYFRAIDDMLRPDGSVALQAITIDHRRLEATRGGYTWIHKYIFPGGQLPSLTAIGRVLSGHTSLAIQSARRLGPSYARTLEIWRHEFNRNAADIASLGFDETFRRMWNFYLAYSQAGFRCHYLDDWQLRIARE